jgi:hypothetical protein
LDNAEDFSMNQQRAMACALGLFLVITTGSLRAETQKDSARIHLMRTKAMLEALKNIVGSSDAHPAPMGLVCYRMGKLSASLGQLQDAIYSGGRNGMAVKGDADALLGLVGEIGAFCGETTGTGLSIYQPGHLPSLRRFMMKIALVLDLMQASGKYDAY